MPLFESMSRSKSKEIEHHTIHRKKLQTEIMRNEMKSERDYLLSNFRAGVEWIISALRRGFKINEILARGLVRSKIWINTKIMACNFKVVKR